MKKLILVATAVAALAGCASQAELNAMTPEQRQERAAMIGGIGNFMQAFGDSMKDMPPPPRMTNCTRTVSGMNCTTY